MKERPIIFSGEMVRAILDGRKTMTRRVVKQKKDGHRVDRCHWSKTGWAWWHDDERGGCSCKPVTPSYGHQGDRLWVKETWSWNGPGFSLRDLEFVKPMGDKVQLLYKSDGSQADGWKPSIYMPRWASRITLEIVSVKVERLQDISHADVLKEGIEPNQPGYYTCPNGAKYTDFQDFEWRWDSINAKRPGCAWADNPWVGAVEFKKVEVAS